MEYYYELTGNKGENLFESLRQSDYDKLVVEQADNYIEGACPKGEWREYFIEDHLWDKLNGDDLDGITDQVPELKGRSNGDIKKWLMDNKRPSWCEDEHIREWALERADFDAQECLWDYFDHDNDNETALAFGLVKYPEFKDGKYVDNGNDNLRIPVEVANKINKLIERRNLSETSFARDLSDAITKAERDAVESLILISGFYCDIHGGRSGFEGPVPKSEVLTCPSCGHPICPVCANCHNDDPQNEEKAREYLASCDSVSGMAYCGQCGDYSVAFMLSFLKLVKCPLPSDYIDCVSDETRVRYLHTAAVAALSNIDAITSRVVQKFNEGTRGIIKIQDPTGEIWGFPERHPEGWVVTIMYPHER